MIKLSHKKSFKKESDPIVDNPSVAVEDDVIDAAHPGLEVAAPVDPVPTVDPKNATQVIIAETKVVQGGRALVERKQDPPKTVTKLPCGTLKQDW
jgi:hypothetical protein